MKTWGYSRPAVHTTTLGELEDREKEITNTEHREPKQLPSRRGAAVP